ncbi:porin family protein [Xylanibacter rodentium]|uniref:porin family protein n=1 Tax=Xylanibacter rodentium TaxID=2736289 RepID=UPI002586750D|nr:porin family protein [Xylanibacter rodentium]
MKKLFLAAAMMVASLAASAQVYVGGSLGFLSEKANEDADALNTFSIKPEVGYNLNENWAVGIQLGYLSKDINKDVTAGLINVTPYARYTFAKTGIASFFVDGGLTFEFGTADAEGTNWGVGVRPGVKLAVSEKVDVIGKLGYLGYKKNDEKFDGGKSAFGLNIDNTDIEVGVNFNF